MTEPRALVGTSLMWASLGLSGLSGSTEALGLSLCCGPRLGQQLACGTITHPAMPPDPNPAAWEGLVALPAWPQGHVPRAECLLDLGTLALAVLCVELVSCL